MQMRNSYYYLILFIALFTACDKGLSPDMASPKVGFGGTVTFIGNWNSEAKQTYVVLFKDPLLSITDFNVFNLKYVSDTIPNGTQVYHYSTNDVNSLISSIEPGKYSYLAVAQTKRDTLSLSRIDWFIAGLYYSDNDTTQPGKLIIPEATFVDSVNFICNFNDPPVQPPGGLEKLLNSILLNNKVPISR